MDDLTRYWLRKKNLQAQDEYHEHITTTDVDSLNQATMYMFITPLFTTALCYGYSKMRESGGMASHLAWAIMQAKSKFRSASQQSASPQAKWKSPKSKGQSGQGGYGDAEVDKEVPEMKFDPTTAANAYQQIKIDKQNLAGEKVRQNKEKAQEILEAKNRGRGMVRNIDPFEREKRQQMRLQQQDIDFSQGATRKTSKKEDRLQREQNMKDQESPGSYMDRAQREQMEKHQPITPTVRQSINKEVLGGFKNPSTAHQSIESENNSRRFSGKTVEFLRRLQFGFIRDKFAKGGFWGRKTTVILFMAPIFTSFCIGVTQMGQASLNIYLKYQALVDAYYYQELAVAEAAVASATAKSNTADEESDGSSGQKKITAADLIEQAKQTASATSSASTTTTPV